MPKHLDQVAATPTKHEQIAGMRISGRFHAHDVDAFLAYLASLPGVQVKRDGERAQVTAAASPKRTRHRL